jgi:hypothetical protein
VALSGNQAEEGEKKPQAVASGETSLLDEKTGKIIFSF